MGRELRKKYVGEGSRELRFMVAYSVLSQYFMDSGRSVAQCSTVEGRRICITVQSVRFMCQAINFNPPLVIDIGRSIREYACFRELLEDTELHKKTT